MAGIQRFITYIYAYEEGRKGANKGFAKVEVRGDDCRMEIYIRDIRRNCLSGEVFLFREKAGLLESIFVGELTLSDGKGDCRVILKTERIGNTERSFRDMEGVMILLEDETICLSRWREGRPIDVRSEKIKRWETTAKRQEVQPEELQEVEPDNAPEELQKVELASAPEELQEVQPDSVPEELQKVEPDGAPEELQKVQPVSAPEKLQKVQTNSVSEEQENIQATEVPMRNVFPQYEWLEVWEELQRTHPTFLIQQEKDILCVRIEVKDLRELPQKYWYLGNNSFLLHGFFNYRYIIIGRLEEDRWFIGVPGIYQPQERVMAAIFGFTEFLPQEKIREKKEAPMPAKTKEAGKGTSQNQHNYMINQFGYWYHVF